MKQITTITVYSGDIIDGIQVEQIFGDVVKDSKLFGFKDTVDKQVIAFAENENIQSLSFIKRSSGQFEGFLCRLLIQTNLMNRPQGENTTW